MSGRATAGAVRRALATLLAACALLPLVDSGDLAAAGGVPARRCRPGWARPPGGCRWPGR